MPEAREGAEAVSEKHTDDCGRSGNSVGLSCKLDCACWCHVQTMSEKQVPERWQERLEKFKRYQMHSRSHGWIVGSAVEAIVEAIDELGTAESLVRELARELNHVQWVMGRCPVCVNRDKRGHSDDCTIKAALARIPKEFQP